ncbi:MAG TPA: histidinol-phosphate transaminase [Clostridiales bacterium]|nr:histidinol-phosphate transaminase [Clostridiales bacterium]
MTYRLNEKIRDLKPYDPIAGTYRIRLDANESFLPVPEVIRDRILKAAAKIQYHRYPDPKAEELCARFAEYYGVNPGNVTAGNGSDELISVICNAFLMKGETMMTLCPDFSMYRFYSSISESFCVEYQKKPDLSIDVDELIQCVNRRNVKLLIFSNPCNPTSLGLKKEEVRRLIRSVHALVVLDEAYMDFWDQSLIQEADVYDNLIILRTFSKAFGMAGIRLGFAVANGSLTSTLKAVKSPYNVNTLTQAIGSVVLSEPEILLQGIQKILHSRDELYREMKRLEENFSREMHVYPSVTNFILVRLEEAKEVYLRLLQEGIAVRFMGDFLRITAGTEQENRDFVSAFERALSAN